MCDAYVVVPETYRTLGRGAEPAVVGVLYCLSVVIQMRVYDCSHASMRADGGSWRLEHEAADYAVGATDVAPIPASAVLSSTAAGAGRR